MRGLLPSPGIAVMRHVGVIGPLLQELGARRRGRHSRKGSDGIEQRPVGNYIVPQILGAGPQHFCSFRPPAPQRRCKPAGHRRRWCQIAYELAFRLPAAARLHASASTPPRAAGRHVTIDISLHIAVHSTATIHSPTARYASNAYRLIVKPSSGISGRRPPTRSTINRPVLAAIIVTL